VIFVSVVEWLFLCVWAALLALLQFASSILPMVVI